MEKVKHIASLFASKLNNFELMESTCYMELPL